MICPLCKLSCNDYLIFNFDSRLVKVKYSTTIYTCNICSKLFDGLIGFKMNLSNEIEIIYVCIDNFLFGLNNNMAHLWFNPKNINGSIEWNVVEVFKNTILGKKSIFSIKNINKIIEELKLKMLFG